MPAVRAALGCSQSLNSPFLPVSLCRVLPCVSPLSTCDVGLMLPSAYFSRRFEKSGSGSESAVSWTVAGAVHRAGPRKGPRGLCPRD